MPPTLGARAAPRDTRVTAVDGIPPRHPCAGEVWTEAAPQEKSPDSGSLMSGLGSSSTLTSLNVTTRTFLTKRAGR